MHCLLMGQSLFGGGKQALIKEKILNQRLKFDLDSYPGISWQARELLEFMLERNFHLRLSAKECLDSAWFKMSDHRRRKSSVNMNIPVKKR